MPFNPFDQRPPCKTYIEYLERELDDQMQCAENHHRLAEEINQRLAFVRQNPIISEYMNRFLFTKTEE